MSNPLRTPEDYELKYDPAAVESTAILDSAIEDAPQ